MTATVQGVYAINEAGEVCLSLPRAIDALSAVEPDRFVEALITWLRRCEAIGQEWRPEPDQPAATATPEPLAWRIALGFLEALAEQPADSTTVDAMRVVNLARWSWAGAHPTVRGMLAQLQADIAAVRT